MDQTDLLILGLTAVLILGGFSLAVYQSRKRAELLERQAEKRGGQITGGGLFHHKKLLLSFQGMGVAIYTIPGGRNRPARTVAQTASDSPRFPTISIVRNDLVQKIMTTFGKERVSSGNEEFDRRFVITSEDAYQAQRLLSTDVQNEILQFPFRGLNIKIKPQAFSLSIMGIPRDDEGYDRFIDLVYHILQHIT